VRRRLLFPLFISLCLGHSSLFADELRIESTPPGAPLLRLRARLSVQRRTPGRN
jgi:hypothetical protein